MIKLPDVPQGSVLGLNYSGMHDSAMAIVAPDGMLVFACALERLSRVKQDGRPPDALMKAIPWDKISAVAISTDEQLDRSAPLTSFLHPAPLATPRLHLDNEHGAPFYEFVRALPSSVPVHFVCHHMAHACSAFWPSGFDEALCLTYDGGMSNCAYFGGLYRASTEKGIEPLDRFPTGSHARISVLYSFVTGLLGFTPNKHEGKLTGLAAYGTPTPRCRALLDDWMGAHYHEIESLSDWYFVYDTQKLPQLAVNTARRKKMLDKIAGLSREELAATVQAMAEEHVLAILDAAKARGWTSRHICLSGGLFSNVKINQRVKAWGFESIFVSPPMTDDGTAYGAALHVLAQKGNKISAPQKTMAVGPSFDEKSVIKSMDKAGLLYQSLAGKNAADVLADLLAQGEVVGFFSQGMEFGPRALGNRSILASASDASINKSLNDRLNRTEFMPFAPMTCIEDVDLCYTDLKGCLLTAEYMTITTNCTPIMREKCPAVVHVDGTARPQLVRKDKLPLIHAIIQKFKAKTGAPSIVNTSFNIHEEPIVCSPDDAIEGFLGSGLDVLFFDVGAGYLARFNENKDAALALLQRKRREKSRKEESLSALLDELFYRHAYLSDELVACQDQLRAAWKEKEASEQASVMPCPANQSIGFGAALLNKLRAVRGGRG